MVRKQTRVPIFHLALMNSFSFAPAANPSQLKKSPQAVFVNGG
jgi:hypothetical protein